jgi:D-beta-D-heptose 7-phosphate kinase/D-beta-D-heptose 1-phosphate adenosyltransferase
VSSLYLTQNTLLEILKEDAVDKREKLYIVSGGFDPIHSGHVDLIRGAWKLAGKNPIVVILNSDEWLTRKKGKPFMDYKNRKSILDGLLYVRKVYKADDADNSVCKTLTKLYDMYIETYDIVFVNGGDRDNSNTPEGELCKDMGIELAWGVGGEKIFSSSKFLDDWENND